MTSRDRLICWTPFVLIVAACIWLLWGVLAVGMVLGIALCVIGIIGSLRDDVRKETW